MAEINPEFRYNWIGLTFSLVLSDDNSGFINALEYPDDYFGEAIIIPNTSRIIWLSITTPFGIYEGPICCLNEIEDIFLTLAADEMNSPEMTVDVDKENVNPREYIEFINSRLE
uniref:Uncharacterized protein n=1 Tax=Panagrolaimus superbus TaxID=310955 RepID=A0A914XVB9_9BILA